MIFIFSLTFLVQPTTQHGHRKIPSAAGSRPCIRISTTVVLSGVKSSQKKFRFSPLCQRYYRDLVELVWLIFFLNDNSYLAGQAHPQASTASTCMCLILSFSRLQHVGARPYAASFLPHAVHPCVAGSGSKVSHLFEHTITRFPLNSLSLFTFSKVAWFFPRLFSVSRFPFLPWILLSLFLRTTPW